MAGKFMKGPFTPKNPKKYIGANVNNITYRSSWEYAAFSALDNLPYFLAWASESISIPYMNPLTKKGATYIPDLFVIYMKGEASNKKYVELWEIKPAKENPDYSGHVSYKTKLVQTINAAKWHAAVLYCAQRGWTFRIITETDLFKFKRK